jgi:excisionase family DNA binding protein
MLEKQLAYNISEAGQTSKTGRTAIYDAIRSGELRAVKRGRRTLILADDLRQWLESLPVFIPKNSPRNEAPRCGDHNATGFLSTTAKKVNDDENVLRRPSVRHESEPIGAPEQPPRARGRPREIGNSR